MPSLANSTLRLLRRLLGAPERGPRPHAGSATVLDGNTAVAHTEAGICEVAGVGGSYPADAAGLAWRLEQARLGVNAFGAPLDSRCANDARGALAAAIGLATTGARATGFLSGAELRPGQDLLASATARRLPLVLHLAGRSSGGPGPVLGNGQDGFHAAAEAGCLVLVAANVQEAVDFSLLARRVCEQALLPGVVAMDGPEVALAVQDVRPASPRLIRELLGDPGDQVPCTDPAQQQWFGEERRRLPCWHDPYRPVMLGAALPAEVAAPARAAAHAYLDAPLDALLDAAMHRFGELTGRAHRSLSTHRLDDAKLVLVAMGAAIETAEAVADRLREPAAGRSRLMVGVLGLRRLHPFPGAELVRLLGQRRVCVLECVDAPLADDPPLLRQLRAALDRAGDNATEGTERHPGYPSLAAREHPRLLSVIYGLGGQRLRGGDLLRLCREAEHLDQPRVYLGVDFAQTASDYPKRQVLLDQLRRTYPQRADLGIAHAGSAGGSAVEDLRPAGAVTLAIEHRGGVSGGGLMTELAALLHRADGGGLRALPALFDQAWGQVRVERITSAAEALRETGDDGPVELYLRLNDQRIATEGAMAQLTPNGILLVQTPSPEERCWARLADTERERFKAGAGQLYLLPPAQTHSAEDWRLVGGPSRPSVPHQDPGDDYRLGAVCAMLLQQGLMDLTRRRLLGLRTEMLRDTVADVDARLQLFEAGLDAPRRVDVTRLPRVSALDRADRTGADADRVPALISSGSGRAGGSRDAYDSLPRFWDRIGVLYRNGDTAQLGPEPTLALGVVPALSSAFRDLSPLRERLPVLDPDLCTGCGACWSACPESAIAALAITPRQLIDAGIAAAGADALRPLASKLTAGLGRLCLSTEYAPGTAAELIDSASAQLVSAPAFPAERKQAITDALGPVLEAIGPAQLVATEALFRDAESERSGTGALLALSVNPDSCKACGLCVAACAPAALRNERQGSRALEEARRLRAAWERLPDTSPAVVERAAGLPEPGALAAMLLGRGATQQLIGGDGSEPGSGARLALRLTLTALAARQGAVAANLAAEIDGTRDRITALVRTILADALPAGDLDALSERLRAAATRHADLGELLGRTDAALGGALDGAVDVARLRRLVDLAQDLGDWAWRLRTGAHGFGRAGCGLVLSPGAAVGWAGAFPDNPFAAPVVLDWSGDGADLAAGLLEGQLRQATRDLALLRKARLELEQPADAARQWADLDGLSWRDLDDHELACCPSLLLVGDSGSLGGAGLSSLYRLLGSDLPVRLLLLADLDLGLGSAVGLGLPAAALQDAAIDLGLLALSCRDAYLAQGSIAAPGHLAACLDGAAGHRGPALLHLHAPSPERHGFATDRTLERARGAVAARVLPLFRYDPGADGVFGSRIDLGGNPDADAPWSDGPDVQPMTPAHWAVGEARFAERFQPLDEAAPEPTPLPDYLALSAPERANRTPYVETATNGAERWRLRVDAALVRVCQERQQAWRVLQELAGLVTPFTARVQQEAESAVAAERQAELAALTVDYERRIQDLRADFEQELRRDIKDRLMGLAGYRETPAASEVRHDA